VPSWSRATRRRRSATVLVIEPSTLSTTVFQVSTER
jgi:hypothetical protein